MTKGETSSTFKAASNMSADECRSFNRWLMNNAVIGSVVAAGIVAIVLIGPSRPGGPPQTVHNASAVELSAAARAD